MSKPIYDNNWFFKRIKESHPNDYNDYVLQDNYVNNHTPIHFLHKTCNQVITIKPSSFMIGCGCTLCGHRRAAHKTTKTLEEAQNSIPPYIKIVGEFTGVLSQTKVHCNRCNNTYMIKIHDLARKQCCSYCTGRKRESTETFSKEVSVETHGEYSLIGAYTKANEYVYIRHNLCGNIYKVTPHNFKHGRRCPKCNRSRGEQSVIDVLTKANINFVYPKVFPDLVNKSQLHYDFYLPKCNMLIEYQGIQHYQKVKHFGGYEKFHKQAINDHLKREYAKEHNILLLEIPYLVCSKNDIAHCIAEFIQLNTGKPGV